MFLLIRNNGPMTLAPKEFKKEVDARFIFEKLKNKGVQVALIKRVGKKDELLENANGIVPSVF